MLVLKRFIGNRIKGKYKELVENFIKDYGNIGCNM